VFFFFLKTVKLEKKKKMGSSPKSNNNSRNHKMIAQLGNQRELNLSGDGNNELTAEDHDHTKKVGNYEIGRLIGVGPSSKVRLALALSSKEPYAIKIIDKREGLLPPHSIDDVAKKDIAAAKLVRHKHVVNLKEVMQTSAMFIS
jgi:serine/threonine protein kinase